jgi:hypothetical protein
MSACMNWFRMRKNRVRYTNVVTCSLALSLLGGCQSEPDEKSQQSSVAPLMEALRHGPAQLREFIAQQVGGLEKLKVPADDSSIPLPPEDPKRPGRYKTTEAKRYLGKMLFHDPVRTGADQHQHEREPAHGTMLSGRAIDNDDPLSRRDEGLEFLDVTQQVRVDRSESHCFRSTAEDIYRLTNTSDVAVDTHLLIIVRGLRAGVHLKNESGTTHNGEPYIRVFLPDGVLQPGQQITQRLVFSDAGGKQPAYAITLLSGQGAP